MKINGKKLAAGTVIAAALLCAVSVGVNAPAVSNVFAATVTADSDTSARPEKGEKPEEKGTRYVGKITSLTSSTITVALGEMKRPEKPADDAAASTDGTTDSAKEKKDRKPDRKPESTAGSTAADSTAAPQNGEKPANLPEMNMEDRITLTGETKTITISDSTKFRSHGKKKAEGTETAETTEEFTISDLAVDDYITFLADEDGSILEVSKGIGMGGGHGGHGGPHDGRKPEETTAAAE